MKLSKKTITVIILSYNEENNLKDAVNSVLKALNGKFKDYEILISDGGSSDRTLEISDKISSENKKIKVIRNKDLGMGYSFLMGVKNASMDYCTMFPGDNENSGFYFSKTLEKIGGADIIIPYITNQEVRAFHRSLISRAFVLALNVLFGLNLKYYNGLVIYKTETLKKIPITAYNFAYSAEVLIKAIKSGQSYIEVGTKIKQSKNTSKIFKIKNILSVIKTMFTLYYEINIKNRDKYNKKIL